MWIGSLGGERGDVGLLGTYDVSESEAVGSSESYDDGKDGIFRPFRWILLLALETFQSHGGLQMLNPKSSNKGFID